MVRKTMFCIDEEVYDRFDVDEDTRERIEKARKWDLEFLTDQLNEEEIRSGRAYSVEQVYPLRNIYGRVDFELAKTLELEFRKFVVLTLLNPGTPHAPPGAVDMYWHFFILHTEEYYEFCEEVWGSYDNQPGFRHHYPATEETREGQTQAYERTRELYEDVFGEPPVIDHIGGRTEKVWTDVPATCGDSYSGIIEPDQA